MIAAAASSPQCQSAMEGVGAGIGASLRAIDCAAGAMSQAAFGRIFGPDGAFVGPLQVLLTLFVALLGYGFLTGRLRIGLSSLVPRLFTLVTVVTLATSWIAFQSLFWNLTVGAPDQIASALMGTAGSASTIFADKLDVVMFSLMEASGGEGASETTSIFSPPGLLWSGATMLLLGTVGVLATTKIALAVLLSLGPIFIVMALFRGTRGLFTGWLKAVVMVAMAPLFTVLAGSLMLELATPVLAALMATPGEIDVRPAMAFFMIGAVHLALMVMVMKVASTMVSGWTVFGLSSGKGGKDDERERAFAPPPTQLAPPLAGTAPAAAMGAAALAASPPPQRDLRLGTAMPAAANDVGQPGTSRQTQVIVQGAASAPLQAGAASGSRVHGIGSRFKSAPPRATPSRSTEKL